MHVDGLRGDVEVDSLVSRLWTQGFFLSQLEKKKKKGLTDFKSGVFRDGSARVTDSYPITCQADPQGPDGLRAGCVQSRHDSFDSVC